jgi:Effector-associated domain 1
MPDLILEPRDRGRLLRALAHAFHTAERVEGVLDEINFPLDHRPNFASPDATWQAVLRDRDAGVMADGYRSLLGHVIVAYPANRTFQSLAEAYAPDLLQPTTEPDPSADPQGGQPEGGCHVMIRTRGVRGRQDAMDQLRGFGLEPQEVWATSQVALFRVDHDPLEIQSALDTTELDWTVIPPGGPTYLLSQLIVQGPDGRYFRHTDVPAQDTVGDVAADTLGHYPDPVGRATVTDAIGPDGQGERLPPDVTLHDAGVHDGDHLRVGYQTHAGAVNPQYRHEAIVAAANQLRAFVAGHPGLTLWADAAELATVYELEFTQLSIGPRPGPDQEPAEIDRHVVQVELGPDFPQEAPLVFWLSPIFHPNIFPNYECKAARERPAMKGLVCLGELADSYRPGMDFGVLGQAILDIAAFGNYDLYVATGGVVSRDGRMQAERRANFFDPDAAAWVEQHPDRVATVAGERRPEPRPPSRRLTSIVEGVSP